MAEPRNLIQGPAMDMGYLNRTPAESIMGGLASVMGGYTQQKQQNKQYEQNQLAAALPQLIAGGQLKPLKGGPVNLLGQEFGVTAADENYGNLLKQRQWELESGKTSPSEFEKLSLGQDFVSTMVGKNPIMVMKAMEDPTGKTMEDLISSTMKGFNAYIDSVYGVTSAGGKKEGGADWNWGDFKLELDRGGKKLLDGQSVIHPTHGLVYYDKKTNDLVTDLKELSSYKPASGIASGIK